MREKLTNNPEIFHILDRLQERIDALKSTTRSSQAHCYLRKYERALEDDKRRLS